MRLMKNPLIRLSEISLLALVIAHALNGFRLTLIDVGVSTPFQKPLFWMAFAIGVLLFIIGSRPIIGGAY